MANRLAEESSPYLLQHAENPVDWYPWGDEALEAARTADRPVFLSVGYASCHWCHVMAHESFEDDETAELLNSRFVNIKVDREERPDLDRIYMTAVQALTGRGGWPMSVFLTPEGRPFYGGTYFPPDGSHGLPSFRDVLLAVSDAWANRRAELEDGARNLVAAVERGVAVAAAKTGEDLRRDTLDTALAGLLGAFDAERGGWGSAPKFPQPMLLEFLLRRHVATDNPHSLAAAVAALEAMARGGIYDQLGGGFHRYSVDEMWLVPHFEKMLYDNAQLARVYVHAWQVTGQGLFRTIAEETLDYVRREMTDPEGGFYAAQDADTEGEEGKFFTWEAAEIREALNGDAERFLEAYGVTDEGNFEGRSVLSFIAPLEERESLRTARRLLAQLREERTRPARDAKAIASWNGLMLAAFAEAARAFGRDDYREVAERNAEFVLGSLRTGDGRLRRTWTAGESKGNGFLEDYAHVIEGLLELYQTTFDPRWFGAAQALAEVMIGRFSGPTGFWDTSDDHEQLIVRPREVQDNAIPSGGSMAAYVLQRLAQLAADSRYTELAAGNLRGMQPLLARYPLGFGRWLVALDYALQSPGSVAILGDPASDGYRALVGVARAAFRPHQVVAAGDPAAEADWPPLLRGRGLRNGQATAYVCSGFTCSEPVTDPVRLEAILGQVSEGR